LVDPDFVLSGHRGDFAGAVGAPGGFFRNLGQAEGAGPLLDGGGGLFAEMDSEPVDRPDHKEDAEGDDHELDDVTEELAVVEGRDACGFVVRQ